MARGKEGQSMTLGGISCKVAGKGKPRVDKGWGILAHHVPRQKLKMAWTKAAPPSMARKIWWEENQHPLIRSS